VQEKYKPRAPGEPYLELILRADRQQDETNLDLANWFDAMGNVGGFSQFVAFFAFVICGFLAETDFIAFAAKKLYLTRVAYEDFLHKRTKYTEAQIKESIKNNKTGLSSNLD
jgi:hypothetical protein